MVGDGNKVRDFQEQGRDIIREAEILIHADYEGL